MFNEKNLYTVEDLAVMTSLTTRTIRNYLRNGTLKGKKIGGQWRFTKEDIENMFNHTSVKENISNANHQNVINFLNHKQKSEETNIEVCSIIDVHCASATEGHQLFQKLVTYINTNNLDQTSKFNYEYIQEHNKARFTLFGSKTFITNTLDLLN